MNVCSHEISSGSFSLMKCFLYTVDKVFLQLEKGLNEEQKKYILEAVERAVRNSAYDVPDRQFVVSIKNATFL